MTLASTVRGLIPAPAKKALRSTLHRVRLVYTRHFCRFDPAMLQSALVRIGLTEGSCVMVHSSVRGFGGFQGTTLDALAALQATIGTTGTLMMPTMGFTGLAIDYALTEIMDVRRTVSRMGILTDLLRRSPGTVRSVHPTHPVAIWGKDAAAIASRHRLARTPCGVETPFHELLLRDGKILLLDVDIQSMTFLHTLEELHEPLLPRSPFTQEVFDLHARDAQGTTVHTQTRLFDREVAKIRRLSRLVPLLKREGAWHETNLAGLKLVLFDCRAVERAYLELCRTGVHCYEFERLPSSA